MACDDLAEPVLVSRHRLPAGRSAGLYILTPPITAFDRNVTPMGFAGPVLAVLPKWSVLPDPKHRGWVAPVGVAPSALLPPDVLLLAKAHVARRAKPARPMLRALSPSFAAGQTLPTGAIENFQTMDLRTWKGWTPILVDEPGRQ